MNPKFSQKHYVFLAKFFKYEISLARDLGTQHSNRLHYWSQAARLLASELAHDNPKFDRARFYKACGLDKDGE